MEKDQYYNKPQNYLLSWIDNPTKMQEWLVIRRNEIVKQYGYYPAGKNIRCMAFRAIKLKARNLLVNI